MENNLFTRWEQAGTRKELQAVEDEIKQNRYGKFRQLLEGLETRIKHYVDDEGELRVRQLLRKAQHDFPQPGQFSPSWTHIWQELDKRVMYKSKALAAFPPEGREGEWQIILDNPYTNQEIVCYPALSFLDAAYLYGWFRPTLQQNEYIRMQKIQTLLTDQGSRD